MAKATTRKKTKSSARKASSAKRTASTRRSTSSRAGSAAGKSKKAKTKARKAASKKKTAKKPVRKTAKKAAPRKKASAGKTARKAVAKKASKKKAAGKKKAPARKKTSARAKTEKAAAKKKAPAPTPAVKKTSSKAQKPEAPASPPEVSLPSVEDALAQLPYNEGQFVVHPKYGLGKVDRITDRKLSTRTVPCLEISFSYQEMRLTIPVDQVGRSGLRRPISRRQIDEVFKALKGRATFDAKRRSAKRVVDYRKRLNQGDPISLAEAIRDLGRLSLKKSLSYEERKILSTALRILSREVALARGREPDDVREEIEKIVYR